MAFLSQTILSFTQPVPWKGLQKKTSHLDFWKCPVSPYNNKLPLRIHFKSCISNYKPYLFFAVFRFFILSLFQISATCFQKQNTLLVNCYQLTFSNHTLHYKRIMNVDQITVHHREGIRCIHNQSPLHHTLCVNYHSRAASVFSLYQKNPWSILILVGASHATKGPSRS